jgi:uncharacterized protein
VEPLNQVRGISDAVSFARGRQEVDAERIAVWGSSLSGGNVIMAAALDPRIHCVVSQVPFITTGDPAALGAEFATMLHAERAAVNNGAAPTMMPVTDPDGGVCVMAGRDAYEYFERGKPLWRNEVTLSSINNVRAHESGFYIDRIAPRPLLMIIAEDDSVALPSHAHAAFDKAGEPKRKLVVAGGHFVPYLEQFDACTDAVIDWFNTYLR